jgi:hypothetical protein
MTGNKGRENESIDASSQFVLCSCVIVGDPVLLIGTRTDPYWTK